MAKILTPLRAFNAVMELAQPRETNLKGTSTSYSALDGGPYSFVGKSWCVNYDETELRTGTRGK